ncbi:MAG: PAS domain S-box-containing protein [Alphaproteobacteria bacterium]
MSSVANISGEISAPKEFDAALVAHFASHKRASALATIAVALAITIIIWDHVPSAILIPWAVAQALVALLSMARWKSLQRVDDSAIKAHKLIVEAIAWKIVAGAMWGVLAVFSNFYLPQSLEFFTTIAVAAVAVGSISTMAAISAAVYGFIILTFTPFIGFWLMSGDKTEVTLGLLAIVLLGVILNSARTAHAQLLSVLKAEFDNKRLSDEFEAARGDWLELSEATESYAVFDDQDRLVSWNKRYAELMKIPQELLCRGTARAEPLKHGRQAVLVANGNISIEQWIKLRTDPNLDEEDETNITEYEGGVWIQRRERYSENGHLVVSHVDLTEIVKTETALLESEERYRSIAENSPDAIFVYAREKIVYASPAAANLLRAGSQIELLGAPMLSFYHPGDHNLILGKRAEIAETPGLSPSPSRARMRRVDGTYVMTEGRGTDHIWQGQPAVMVIRRDITAQIEAEERLRKSETRYRRIADLSPVAILIRVEDRIVYANPTATKMFRAESEADLLYETMMSFVHPEDQHLVLNNRAMMTEDMETSAPAIKVRRRRFDGSYFHCEGSGAPFVWQGQPAVMVMWRDISAEVEAERALLISA